MYRLFAVLGLMAVAVVGLVLGPEIAEAHHGGGFYWEGFYNWDTRWCQGLFNSSHQLVYYRCY